MKSLDIDQARDGELRRADLDHPSLSHADGQGEVNNMRNVYRAPVDDGDTAAVVDDLATIKGL